MSLPFIRGLWFGHEFPRNIETSGIIFVELGRPFPKQWGYNKDMMLINWNTTKYFSLGNFSYSTDALGFGDDIYFLEHKFLVIFDPIVAW